MKKLSIPAEHVIVVMILIRRFQSSANMPMGENDWARKLIKRGDIANESSMSGNAPSNSKELLVTSLTIHRLMLVATHATHKFYSDLFYKDSDIA